MSGGYYGVQGGAGGGGGGSVAIGPNYGDGQPTATCSVGTINVSGVSTAILAGKDTWIPNVAGCVDNANKNGTDLQVEGVVATRKDSYTGWDLSSYLSSATVTAASLIVNLKTAPLTNTGGVDLNHIPNANETWSETVLTCSGALSLTQFQNEAAGTWAGTGDKTITLNSTARTRIATRMGTGFYSVALTAPNTLFTNMVLQSKDSGGSPGNASGPRLTWSWNKNL